MNILLYLSGIISEVFLLSVFFFGKSKVDNFSFKKHAASFLGSVPKTAKFFNTSLLVYTILRIIFISALLSRFSFWDPISSLLMLMCFGSIILASFVSLDKHEKIHQLAGLSIGICTAVFVFYFAVRMTGFLALINLLLALIMSAFCIYIVVIKKVNTYFELSFFFFIFLWDILMTWSLFTINK